MYTLSFRDHRLSTEICSSSLTINSPLLIKAIYVHGQVCQFFNITRDWDQKVIESLLYEKEVYPKNIEFRTKDEPFMNYQISFKKKFKLLPGKTH